MARKAADGVNCRLIIGTGVKNYSDVELVIIETTFIIAATVTTPYAYNKGIVSDDVAIVLSVNWTPNSFHNNIEGAVAIYSQDVADFFAETFLTDFYEYYNFDGFKVYVTQIEFSHSVGEEIVFTVSVSPESGDFIYMWDFGNNSDPVITYVNCVVHTPIFTGDTGAFELTVTVLNGTTPITVSREYTVGTTESSGNIVLGEFGEYLYITIPNVVILLTIVRAVNRSGNKRKSRPTGSDPNALLTQNDSEGHRQRLHRPQLKPRRLLRSGCDSVLPGSVAGGAVRR